MRRIRNLMIGIFACIMLFSITAFAAEVTPANAVLLTNEETVIYAEADLTSAIILPDIQAGLPVQVTGITNNGFFQIDIGGIYYVPGYGLSPLSIETTPVAQQESKAPEGVPETIYNVKQTYNEFIVRVVELVNLERQAAGLAPLAYDERITYAATQRSFEMAAHNYLEHTRPDGSSCFTVLGEYNISYWGVGENIACGQTTPEKVMTDWMNSTGHRANILTPSYKKIGIGVAANEYGRLYWTQLFVY